MTYCASHTLSPYQKSWFSGIDCGVSAEAKVIELFSRKEIKRMSESISLGWRCELAESANEAFSEASSEGWNGEDALPVTEQTFYNARKVIESLPENIKLPEVMSDINGSILLDWFIDRNNIITIAIKEDKFIYAALFNGHKRHGLEMISNELPEEVIRILTTYFRKS